MTIRERVIEECKAALSAACLGYEYDSGYDSGGGCPTCGPDRVDGLLMEDISKVLDKLKTKPIK